MLFAHHPCSHVCAGMGAGLPDFVVVNLDDLEKHFQAGEDVTLEAVSQRVLRISGRDSKLPLKVSSGTRSISCRLLSLSFHCSSKVQGWSGGSVHANTSMVVCSMLYMQVEPCTTVLPLSSRCMSVSSMRIQMPLNKCIPEAQSPGSASTP